MKDQSTGSHLLVESKLVKFRDVESNGEVARGSGRGELGDTNRRDKGL